MKIFLTNDDGFEAPGLIAIAKRLTALGKVTVIAPNQGRSSCSSSLSLRTYLHLWKKESYEENMEVLSCNGTTADCCKLALEYWLKDDRPDLIVSGINNGNNSGSDSIYSGTMAGAIEGDLLGIPSIALSAEPAGEGEYLERAASFAFEVIRKYFIEKKYKGCLNLNMPEDGMDLTWENLKVARLGIQRYDNAIREIKDLSGHPGYWVSGKMLPDGTPDTDVFWYHRGYPTLTPITWNQTDTGNMERVKEIASLSGK